MYLDDPDCVWIPNTIWLTSDNRSFQPDEAEHHFKSVYFTVFLLLAQAVPTLITEKSTQFRNINVPFVN